MTPFDNEDYQQNHLPPRLLWFDMDWSLAKCHRAIISPFLYILLGDLEGEPTPTYDQIFGLSDPRDEMRQGFDELDQTPVPFLVSLVNPASSNENGAHENSYGPYC